ncbi:MAG: FHA domain-containing protein [Anaerolineales bacterium]|nr:FHA domain-containing protein [Anaerolineales bacterium]
MTATSPRLIVRHGPNPNQEYPLVLTSNIVGREPINDVVFSDPEVSRRHARIVAQNNSYYIEDLGSTNGTFVNGRRINAITRLSNGDIIDLGESIRLTFVREDHAEMAAVPVTNTTPTTKASPITTAEGSPASSAVIADPIVGSRSTLTTGRNLYLIFGCGGLLILALLCMVVLFALDRYAPDLLYSFLQ